MKIALVDDEPNELAAAEFAKTFENIFQKLCAKNPELIINVDGVEISVPYRNIFYVDIEDGHKLCVSLADKKFVTADSYADIADALLQDERFLGFYHRIIINMDYVKLIKEDDFILINDAAIPISKRKKKDVKVKYLRYFANK